jgi:hypothetical protein
MGSTAAGFVAMHELGCCDGQDARELEIKIKFTFKHLL